MQVSLSMKLFMTVKSSNYLCQLKIKGKGGKINNYYFTSS